MKELRSPEDEGSARGVQNCGACSWHSSGLAMIWQWQGTDAYARCTGTLFNEAVIQMEVLSCGGDLAGTGSVRRGT